MKIYEYAVYYGYRLESIQSASAMRYGWRVHSVRHDEGFRNEGTNYPYAFLLEREKKTTPPQP